MGSYCEWLHPLVNKLGNGTTKGYLLSTKNIGKRQKISLHWVVWRGPCKIGNV